MPRGKVKGRESESESDGKGGVLYKTPLMISLCTLVNLLQKDAEDGATEHSLTTWAGHLRDRINKRIDTRVRLRLVLFIERRHAHFLEHLLDLRLRLSVLATIVGVQDRALRRVRVRERRVDAPRALVVHNVRADLPNLLGRPGKVEVVVLDLEVLAEGQEDVERELVVVRTRLLLLLHGEPAKEERERDGEVERVDGRLVDDDCPVSVGVVRKWGPPTRRGM